MRGCRVLIACLAVLAFCVLASACGGGGDGGSSSTAASAGSGEASESNGGSSEGGVNAEFVEQARNDVEAARQPMEKFTGPTESPGPAPSGKKIVAITCSPAPFCNQSAEATQAAGDLLGWETTIVQGDGSPNSWLNAVNTAISSGADGIVLNSADPVTMASAMKRAKDAGIPVVATGVCEKPPAGVVNTVDIPGRPDFGASLGALVAKWIVQNSPEGAKILELTSPAFFCLTIPQKAFEEGIEAAGPAFEIVESQDSPLTDIGSQQGVQRMVSMLRSNPDASYFYDQTSSWAPTFQQALAETGRTGITGVGINGNNFISQIREGFPQVLVGADIRNYGYAAIDSLIRYYNHKPQQTYKELGVQLIDEKNADTTTGDAIKVKYNLPAAWAHLWGVPSK